MGVKICWDVDKEDNAEQYSREGLKVKRVANITGLPTLPTPGSDCSGTLYQLLAGLTDMYGQTFPSRGTPHPSIVIATPWGEFANPDSDNNAFCADVFKLKFLDSTSVQAEVEYSVLNALTQEPSETNDAAPMWLTPASSVQQSKTNVDFQGNQLLCSYKGDYAIYDNFGTQIYGGNSADGGPQSLTTADVMWPNTLLQFQRRMTTRQSAAGIISCLNNGVVSIDGYDYQEDELLIVRYDCESLDGGVSFILTCGIQFRDSTPETDHAPTIPGWNMGDYYRVQNGYAWDITNKWQVAGVGQVPPDAYATVFQIQTEINFDDLNLGNS